MRSGTEILQEVSAGEDQMFELLYKSCKAMPRLNVSSQLILKVTFKTLFLEF